MNKWELGRGCIQLRSATVHSSMERCLAGTGPIGVTFWEDAGWLHSVHHRRFIIPSGFLHGRYNGVTLPRRAVRIRTDERVLGTAAKFV